MEPPTVLLFGGTSSERRVSVASAQHIALCLTRGLPRADPGTPCRPWYIAPDGAVHACSLERLLDHQSPFERDFEPHEPATWPSLEAALDAVEDRAAVFVLALHGGHGEDGTLQLALERRHLAFTGSGSEASARAFDKNAAKALVAARGVPTVAGAVLPRDSPAATAAALGELHAIHGALIVKPVADGSSVGLHVVRDPGDIDAVVAALSRDAQTYLAEALVSGVEITVGVVDDDDGPVALPVTEIRVEQGRMFDFEGKYLGSGTREITPAEIAPDQAAEASRAALVAHAALGCEGYSRTDFILAGGRPVFLETNTLPGLSRASLIPQQLEAAGRSMAAFLARQIAIARHRRDLRTAA